MTRIRKVPDLNRRVGIRELHIASVGNGELSSWVKNNKKNRRSLFWALPVKYKVLRHKTHSAKFRKGNR